ncbi:MAG: hypothetical protein K8R46_13315 [Pirellulales bacterium]|nr:hypothetical protein [Pirellulales bacterium]
MKKKLSSLLVAFTVVLVIGVGSATAFENVTAQEAYDMVNSGQATLIDVRTLEEVVWVGSPALVPGGDPIAYLIPWKFWTGVNGIGKSTYEMNVDFDALVKGKFGDDKCQALITMCLKGKRGTAAAKRLELLDFTNVYELDNALKEEENGYGGCGGFQGTNYSNTYDGYRGHPERLPENNSPWKITVETVTEDINNAEDSVSWKDTGLPITQAVDPNLIPTLE